MPNDIATLRRTALALITGPEPMAIFFASALVVHSGAAAEVKVIHDNSGNLTAIQSASPASPTISTQPASALIESGDSLSFSVNVSSVTPVTYQWKRNGEDIQGATGDTLLITNASVADEGSYTVVITNAQGSVTSNAAVLTINIKEVVAWGLNSSGESTVSSALENVVAIDGGANHSIALRANGTVAAWGLNTSGQTNVPVGLNNAVAIAAGGIHNLALKSDGTVTAWGYNNWGQTNVPVGLSNVVAVAAGYWFSMALKADGTLQGWGHNAWGQTTIPAAVQGKVISVRTGDAHTLALLYDGTVAVWGSNFYNQVTFPGGFANANIVAIAAKGNHCLVMNSSGLITGWGDNSGGPLTIPAGLSDVTSIELGVSHSLALKNDRTVAAWGYNANGQSTVPGVLSPVLAIAAGSNHSLALITADSALVQPVIINAPKVLAGYGASFPFRVLAKNSPTTYTATGLPFGLAINATTGVVTGTVLGVGTFPVTVSATNSFGTTQKTVSVIVLNTAGLTPTQVWRTNYFGVTSNSGDAADLADPEHDGVLNLLEFGTSLNPTTANPMPGQIVRSGGNLEFTYTRSKTAMAEGVTFAVQWSNDLSGPSWNSVGVTESILSEDSNIQSVKALVPDGGGARLFVRLKVTR